MVGDEETQAHRYTVGALLLQAAVLLGIAALSYFGSQSTTYPFRFDSAAIGGVILGVPGVIAIWLAGEHNTNNVRSGRLQLWAVICIILALYPS